MDHVCLHIWRIYVNIIVNQDGHIYIAGKSGKTLCATYTYIHVIRINVRCKKYTYHLLCRMYLIMLLVIHEQRRNVTYATFILNIVFHMYDIDVRYM